MKKITMVLALIGLAVTSSIAHTDATTKANPVQESQIQKDVKINGITRTKLKSILTDTAHSGGTDRYGCHIDHSTGVRHCH